MLSKIQRQLDKNDRLMESVIAYLEPYNEEQLNRQPGTGQWSALQVVHHVLRAEKLSLAYVQKKLSFNPKLPSAGLSWHWRSIVLWLATHVPVKLKAPANVSTEFLPEHSNLAETIASWKQVRSELRAYLGSLPDDLFNKIIYRHPIAGLMPLQGMLYFFYAHSDRHFKQIKRTLLVAKHAL